MRIQLAEGTGIFERCTKRDTFSSSFSDVEILIPSTGKLLPPTVEEMRNSNNVTTRVFHGSTRSQITET